MLTGGQRHPPTGFIKVLDVYTSYNIMLVAINCALKLYRGAKTTPHRAAGKTKNEKMLSLSNSKAAI
jgi:hypothetical protein